jgi:hypothetical protein
LIINQQKASQDNLWGFLFKWSREAGSRNILRRI